MGEQSLRDESRRGRRTSTVRSNSANGTSSSLWHYQAWDRALSSYCWVISEWADTGTDPGFGG